MTPQDFDRCLDAMDKREGPPDHFPMQGCAALACICGAVSIVAFAAVAWWLDLSVWTETVRRF